MRDRAGVQRRARGGARLSAEWAIELVEAEFESAAVQGLLEAWNRELIAINPKLQLGGSRIRPGDFSAPGGVFLLATSNGTPMGCGGARGLSPGVGEVKRLFVSREARGRGAGRLLLVALEERAARLGYERLRLDTPGTDAASLGLFRAAGYEPIPDYNGNTRARYWFEKALGRARG